MDAKKTLTGLERDVEVIKESQVAKQDVRERFKSIADDYLGISGVVGGLQDEF